jgi:hypothetical protein
MAQELVVKDDLSGELNAEPVQFAIDGAEYEIDLADKNSARLREFLAEFIAAARPVGSAAPVRRRHAPAFDFDPIEVRAWWKKNPAGLPQWRAKGKVPGVVVDAWRAATQ